MPRSILTWILLLLAMCGASAASAQIANPGFEADKAGAPPSAPWRAFGAGYTAEVTDQDPGKDARSLRLSSAGSANSNASFGRVSQVISAVPYRGRRIALRALARAPRSSAGSAGLWLRIDTKGQAVFNNNMLDRPISSAEWKPYEIEAEVPADADQIVVGLLLQGTGEVFVDAYELQDLGASGVGVEAARTLSKREMVNLAAFGRAYGYARYFQPTAVGAEWDSLALAGVLAVQNARSAGQLAAAIQGVLKPFAPEVKVWPASMRAPSQDLASGDRVRFRHRGLGPQTSSARKTVYETGTEAVSTAELFTTELPGGLRLSMPLGNVPPNAIGPVRLDKPDGFRPTGDDRITRIADVIIAWNVLQHFYPYFEQVEANWFDQLERSLGEASEARDAEAFTQVLNRLVVALNDGHGSVGGPQPRSAFAPVWFAWIEDQLVVSTARPGGELKRGDVIRRIDGRAASELMDEAIASSSGATSQWRRWRALAKIRGGKPGPMLLEGVRVDGSAFTITVIRDLQAGELEPSDRPPSITELKPGVAYVDLTRADAAAYRAALPKLAQAKTVIFDVRGYPSVPRGVLNAMSDRTIKSAKMEAPLVTRPDHTAFDWVGEGWTIPAQGNRLSGKLIFITDGRAISYAESILGVVEGERLGPIVGEPTAGTNGDVNPLPLAGGYTLAYTGLRVTKQDGSRHHGIGIIPTHPVSRSLAGFRAGRDEQLDVALSLAEDATP